MEDIDITRIADYIQNTYYKGWVRLAAKAQHEWQVAQDRRNFPLTQQISTARQYHDNIISGKGGEKILDDDH